MPATPFQTAAQIFEAMTSSVDTLSNLNRQFRIAAERSGATRAILLTQDAAAGEPHISASFGLGVSEYRRLESKLGSSILRKVFASGSPVHLPDSAEDEAFREEFERMFRGAPTGRMVHARLPDVARQVYSLEARVTALEEKLNES